MQYSQGMAASTDGVVDFGQSVDLTSRIREVLRGYPEGTAVFKELLQNADDAGARTFTLCLDLRSHDASLSSLLPGASAAAASLQGPALLAYNDASFTAADFVGISRLGDSGKAAGGVSRGATQRARTLGPRQRHRIRPRTCPGAAPDGRPARPAGTQDRGRRPGERHPGGLPDARVR